MTLTSEKWYAMSVWSPEPGAEVHHSPIRVLEVRPLKTGQGRLELAFYHANYPEGVREKRYELKVVSRLPQALVAERIDDGGRSQLIVLSALTREWLRETFPDWQGDAEIRVMEDCIPPSAG